MRRPAVEVGRQIYQVCHSQNWECQPWKKGCTFFDLGAMELSVWLLQPGTAIPGESSCGRGG